MEVIIGSSSTLDKKTFYFTISLLCRPCIPWSWAWRRWPRGPQAPGRKVSFPLLSKVCFHCSRGWQWLWWLWWLWWSRRRKSLDPQDTLGLSSASPPRLSSFRSLDLYCLQRHWLWSSNPHLWFHSLPSGRSRCFGFFDRKLVSFGFPLQNFSPRRADWRVGRGLEIIIIMIKL